MLPARPATPPPGTAGGTPALMLAGGTPTVPGRGEADEINFSQLTAFSEKLHGSVRTGTSGYGTIGANSNRVLSNLTTSSDEVDPPVLRVTRGLDPRVHLPRMKMDCRVKPGNDAEQMRAKTCSKPGGAA